MESDSVCNHTCDLQNWMTARRESDLSITSVITDRIGRHEFLLPIIKNNRFNFRKKRLTLRTNISGRDNVRSKKNLSVLEIPQFFDGCCYGYCDQFCDWWIWLTGLTMIGCFNCPITGVRLQSTSRLQLSKMISEK